ncbi:mucin-5AC [Musca domestica]|uniref:Mucin-5AC n=1 Tax=Musca domestica TaxID=7370 RepID=A0A9J7DFM3_MUSDO|nr:mucin-5AC [Musca domestica]XP_058988238.1 mucin-5AC [Musca domestica]
MAHFCGFIKFIFLLLMLTRILPKGEARPLSSKSTTSSDLIAGNEFLKLFMGHEELEREFLARQEGDEVEFKESEEFDKKFAETARNREAGSRSLKIQGPRINHAEGQAENSKARSSGSRISFLEDYDENDAILDAEARDIDLKREPTKAKKDDYKVLSSSSVVVASPATSSSTSSSQRGSMTGKNRLTTATATTSKYDNKSYTTTQSVVTMTPRPPTATTYRPPSTTLSTTTTTTTTKSKTTTKSPLKTAKTSQNSAAASTTTGDNFINRSHKSEFSVEEVQPSTARHQQLLQQQNHQRQRKVVRKTLTRHHHEQQHHTSYPLTNEPDSMEALDSENSASTNVEQNVLASPGQGSSGPLRSTSTVTTMFHSGQHNVSINHAMSKTPASHQTNVDDVDISKDLNDQQHSATGVDDQLLPFQTVIYHDTKSGNSHGPQSRSISYSSISQNVEDLKKWHQSGILAEARRNVSESLKPLPTVHQSEPAKFYSQPSKMYSEPSKFYSEPSKVYSEPAKVYGEPEKFYSEPAKVYGQPSKFYSEPSKVYSEPAKMYGEPAKTYWPITVTTTTRPPSTIRPITTTNLPPIVTTTTASPLPIGLGYPASRKPAAIVSRIAFGEAQSSTPSTATTSSSITTTTTPAPTAITSTIKSLPSFGGSFHQHTFGQRQPPSETTTPPRRILFNLDRLPYDLLNAPQPATQQTPTRLELPQQPALTYQQQQQSTQQQQTPTQTQQQQQRHHNINPCLESAVSSLFSSATLSAHPALIKQRQQHSSLSDQQHSNQNAKGLPNEDLVRCVAEIPSPSIPPSGAADDTGLPYTTERSNIEELFTPTPEQNYEIEESASVMTNGRAHGVQGGSGGGRNSLTLPTPQPGAHSFQANKQRIHFGTNINAGVSGVSGGGGTGSGYLNQQSSFNGNANANGDAALSHPQHPHRNLHGDGNPSPDYNAYDDGGGGGGGGVGETDDYTDDETGQHRPPGASNDGDDSKVAYVVEGRNYRKYRVETKTDDGYIVGEYGVVHHDDGNLRGVRYTADINNTDRSLIQKALLTFLKL